MTEPDYDYADEERELRNEIIRETNEKPSCYGECLGQSKDKCCDCTWYDDCSEL